MTAMFLSHSQAIAWVTISIVDQAKLIARGAQHLNPSPSILIATSGVEFEADKPNASGKKFSSVVAIAILL